MPSYIIEKSKNAGGQVIETRYLLPEARLTANATSGQNKLSVTDTSPFKLGDRIELKNSLTENEVHTIALIKEAEKELYTESNLSYTHSAQANVYHVANFVEHKDETIADYVEASTSWEEYDNLQEIQGLVVISGQGSSAASDVNVIASVLPSGASSETTLSGIKTSTDKLTFTGTSLDVNVASGASNEQYADGTLIAGGEKGTIIAGSDGTNFQHLKSNALGELQVGIVANVLPADASTETTLLALNTKVTTCDTGAVIVSSSALPTGASTEATLLTLSGKDFSTETTLSSLNAKVTACDTGAVIVSSSALPTGASSEATLSALNSKIKDFDLDTGAGVENVSGMNIRLSASGGSVEGGTLANPLRVDVTGTTTQPISALALPLPSGASTEATLSALNAKVSICDTNNVSLANLSPNAATESTLSAVASNTLNIDSKIIICDTGNVAITTPLPAGTNLIGNMKISDGTDVLDIVTSGSSPVNGIINYGVDNVKSITVPILCNANGELRTETVSSVLPTGASSEVTLSSLNSKVTACDTGAVVISSALPPGANTIGSVQLAEFVNSSSTGWQQKSVTAILNDGTDTTISLPMIEGTSRKLLSVSVFIDAPSNNALMKVERPAATQIASAYVNANPIIAIRNDGLNANAAQVLINNTGVGANAYITYEYEYQ